MHAGVQQRPSRLESQRARICLPRLTVFAQSWDEALRDMGSAGAGEAVDKHKEQVLSRWSPWQGDKLYGVQQ